MLREDGATRLVWDSRLSVEVGVDHVAPELRVRELLFESQSYFTKTSRIDVCFNALPGGDHSTYLLDAAEVRIVDVLDHGCPARKEMGVWYVMEKQQERIGAFLQ